MRFSFCSLKILTLQLLTVLVFLLCRQSVQSQNQKLIDSLLQVSETTTDNKLKVNAYAKIAAEYHILDSTSTYLYAYKAIKLAKQIGYTEGTIDPLFSAGYTNIFKGNYDDAERIFQQMMELSKKNNYKKGEATSLYGLGWLNTYFAKNDIGLEYLLESLKMCIELEENELTAKNYSVIGIIYMKKTNYNKAIDYYFKSLKINEELNKPSDIAGNYTNIGIIYKNQGNYKKASEYYMKAVKIFERLNLKSRMASTYTNIGVLFDLEGDYDKALEYQFKSVKIREEFGLKRGIAYNYDNIGMVYMSLNSYPEALEYFSKALKILDGNKSHADKAFPLIQIGHVYSKLNQPRKAKKYLEEGLSLAKETGLLSRVREGAELLSLVEKDLGNYKNAYEAVLLFKETHDSINNLKNIEEVIRLESEYMFKIEKDSLKFEQTQEMLLLREEAKRRAGITQTIYIAFAILLISGFIGFLFVNKNFQRKKVQSIRDNISQDLHDEIGSNLSSISLFGTVAEKSIKKDPNMAIQLLSRINTNATQTIESINDIVWAISSENDTLLHLVNRMQAYASEMEDTNQWQIKINYNPKESEIALNMVQRRNIYLIFKESINNAIKYSQGNTIRVDIENSNKLFKLLVTDNGVGFDMNNTYNKSNMLGGNGLKNMKSRAEELHGELTIVSKPNIDGTRVLLQFTTKA